jgi:hypothetical protein
MKMLNKKHYVIPAKAGIQKNLMEKDWIPACAGMTIIEHFHLTIMF